MATNKTRKKLKNEELIKMMDTHKVNCLFKNHKNEYFTNANLAELSLSAEDKKAKRSIETITREGLTKTTDKE
jgi:superoxide dismutase